MSMPLEHDYIGFSPPPAEDSSVEKTGDAKIKSISALIMNMKATELKLGLPGSESPRARQHRQQPGAMHQLAQ
ncbi:unnamed protein product [Linum trigynum]|uniref:Uncharacterized protein n=1 Tax=Linum trigynum TaxID=586398 RepID=A0AAV2CBQ4_9ROSI